jgi:hypothetical protein
VSSGVADDLITANSQTQAFFRTSQVDGPSLVASGKAAPDFSDLVDAGRVFNTPITRTPNVQAVTILGEVVEDCICTVWRWIEKYMDSSVLAWACYEYALCHGTGPECPAEVKHKWPCDLWKRDPEREKPWWWDLPECPTTHNEIKRQMRDTFDRGESASMFYPIRVPRDDKGRCDEGPNPENPEADRCYRQIKPDGGPGQQCCYVGDTLLAEGASAGTPDRVATAVGLQSNGKCVFDLLRVLEHVAEDVQDWHAFKQSKGGWKFYFHGWPPSGSIIERRLREAWLMGAI